MENMLECFSVLLRRCFGLIAILTLRYLQLKSKFSWSLSNLVVLLRMNLLTYRDL